MSTPPTPPLEYIAGGGFVTILALQYFASFRQKYPLQYLHLIIPLGFLLAICANHNMLCLGMIQKNRGAINNSPDV